MKNTLSSTNVKSIVPVLLGERIITQSPTIKHIQRILAGIGIWATGNDLLELLESIKNLF